MILIINGTNRPNNRTQVISRHCYEYLLNTHNGGVKYLSLEELSNNILSNAMYDKDGQDKELRKIQQELMIPIKNWIIISPEYNGSYPGILKLFIDTLSVNDYKQTFSNKKVGLIGTSDGRAGNLRGMEHLSGLLNYLKITTYHNKLPISSINTVVNKQNIQEETIKNLESYLQDFVNWLEN